VPTPHYVITPSRDPTRLHSFDEPGGEFEVAINEEVLIPLAPALRLGSLGARRKDEVRPGKETHAGRTGANLPPPTLCVCACESLAGHVLGVSTVWQGRGGCALVTICCECRVLDLFFGAPGQSSVGLVPRATAPGTHT
jgi:hypothetical protein